MDNFLSLFFFLTALSIDITLSTITITIDVDFLRLKIIPISFPLRLAIALWNRKDAMFQCNVKKKLQNLSTEVKIDIFFYCKVERAITLRGTIVKGPILLLQYRKNVKFDRASKLCRILGAPISFLPIVILKFFI